MSENIKPPRKAMEVFIWILYGAIVLWIVVAVERYGVEIDTSPLVWVAVAGTIAVGVAGLFLAMKFWLDTWEAVWIKNVKKKTQIKTRKGELKAAAKQEIKSFASKIPDI